MTEPRKSPHCGSTLDDFLNEKGILEEVEAEAKRRVEKWQLDEEMKQRGEAGEAAPPQVRKRA